MSKNIPGIVRRTRRRNEEKVRILVQPNPYPLEQPGMQQPNVSDPMTPPMQPGMQPYPGQPGMQPHPGQPGAPGGPGAMTPTSAPIAGQVVPMQSSGRWRGDPALQGAQGAQDVQPFQQGNNQAWQGGPQKAASSLPQQPAQPYNNQQPWPANSLQQPTTPPQMQKPAAPLPYNNNTTMQPGRNTPPPQSNVLSQPPTPSQRFAPTPQYSPELPHTPAPSHSVANSQYPPAQPQRMPMNNPGYPQPPQPQPPSPRTPNGGILAPTPSSPPLQPAGAVPGAPTAQISIEIDGKIIQECRLDKPALTVGRQDGRDIQIKHQSVSRTHAKIIVENGSWVVEDAGSVNGIVFNGHRVQRATVKNGDRVFIAPNIALIFKIA